MGERLYLGIDPGVHGALAILDNEGAVLGCYDTPTVPVGKGTKLTYAVAEMRALVEEQLLGRRDNVLAVIEDPAGAGGLQGTWYTGLMQGIGCGLWQGLMAGMQVPFMLVPATTWTGKMGLHGKDKRGHVVVAQRLFPAASWAFTGPRGGAKDGRADAALIAEWARKLGK